MMKFIQKLMLALTASALVIFLIFPSLVLGLGVAAMVLATIALEKEFE